MKLRIGLGFDVHRLAQGEEFWLGGIKIEHTQGTVAHSDGDVLIHAICDAMLGAVNLGDIGKHFPDTSAEFKQIDSKVLLKRTLKLIQEKGYAINNIDSTICLQKPKIASFIPLMQQTLAEILGVEVEDVSIKATTTEKLGFEGREEGVSAYAVVLLSK